MRVQKIKKLSLSKLHTFNYKLRVAFAIAIVVIMAIVAIAFMPIGANQAHALDTSGVLYHHFDSPTAISSHGNNIYIASGSFDGSTIYRYALSSDGVAREVTPVIQVRGRVDQLIVSGGRFFMLVRHSYSGYLPIIAVYTTTGERFLEPDNAPFVSFSSIAVMGSSLFASTNLNHILFEFSIHPTSITFNRQMPINTGGAGGLSPIEGLLTIGDFLYIARFELNNLVLRRFAVTAEGPQHQSSIEIAGMQPFAHMHAFGTDEIAVFARGDIMVVHHLFFAPPTILDNGRFSPDLVGATVLNNRIYKLFASAALHSFSVEINDVGNRILADERLLVASRSDIHGFFNSPADTASSGGRVFIADRHNNRLVIKSGDNDYAHLPLGANSQPTSVTARHGMLYVAHQRVVHTPPSPPRVYSVISVFNIAGSSVTLINTVTFLPGGVINRVRVCSDGYLYVLAQDNTLWRYPTLMGNIVEGSLARTAVGLSRVTTLDAPLFRPNMYVVKANPIGSGYSIVRLINNGENYEAITALSSLEGVIDIAPDSNGAMYVLKQRVLLQPDNSYIYGFSLLHYPASTVAGVTNNYTYINSQNPRYRHSDKLFSPTGIHLSGVDFRQHSSDTALAHRDILITDFQRHRVWHLATHYRFSVDNYFVYDVDNSALSNNFNRYEDLPANHRIIHTLTQSAPLWLNASDVFPLTRMHRTQRVVRQAILPNEFYVIVPFGLNHDSDFTFIIADNIEYYGGASFTVFAGYVRTNSISATAEPYIPPEDDRQRLMPRLTTGTRVYKFPAHQFHVTQILPYRTVMYPLDFTFRIDPLDNVIQGYFDNRNTPFAPQLIRFYHWLRVRFVCSVTGDYLEGFVNIDTVTMYEAPHTDVERENFVTNAIVIRAPFDEQYATGATVFAVDSYGNKMFCEYGYPVASELIQTITFGTRVMVIGNFNTSNEYHRIVYDSFLGTVTLYIRTPNIEYDGIDVLRLVVVLLCVVTVILGGIATARYLSVKKTFKPKEPAESFI